jgi:hypothetical protein
MPAVLWQFQLQFLIKAFFRFNQICLFMSFDVKIVVLLMCGDQWLSPVTQPIVQNATNVASASFHRQ